MMMMMMMMMVPSMNELDLFKKYLYSIGMSKKKATFNQEHEKINTNKE